MSAREDTIIATVLAATPHRPAPEGPGDDAARVGARVITTDLLVEGTHFVRAHPPELLGWKALAVNLSDVAAMGARAEAFTLALGVPRDVDDTWVRAFAAGLGACARWADVVVAGGDTVRADQITISITAWGVVEHALLRRSGGQPGDVLMTVGAIGRAGEGLARWLGHQAADLADPCVVAQLRPEPPIWAGPFAAQHGAHAGMDLSDGLASDLPRLAAASGLALVVDLDHLPADPALTLDARARAAHGEDYGLVVLVPPSAVATFVARGFSAIGCACEGRAGHVVWRDAEREVAPVLPSFAHF